MNEKMFLNLSKALSYIFHPIILPTIIFAIIVFFAPQLLSPLPEAFFLYFLLFVFVSTWLMPALSIYGLYLLGIIKDMNLDSQVDRLVSIVASLTIYTAVTFMFYYKFRVNDKIMILFYTMVLCQALGGAITIFWKISLHAMAAWGMVCYLFALVVIYQAETLFYPAMVCIVGSGSLMSARLYLQKHTIGQVAAGVGLSTAISCLVLYFYNA